MQSMNTTRNPLTSERKEEVALKEPLQVTDRKGIDILQQAENQIYGLTEIRHKSASILFNEVIKAVAAVSDGGLRDRAWRARGDSGSMVFFIELENLHPLRTLYALVKLVAYVNQGMTTVEPGTLVAQRRVVFKLLDYESLSGGYVPVVRSKDKTID